MKRVNARSRVAHCANAGCCTLTATFCPVSLTVARCTCARDAAPIGMGLNSEKYDSMGSPVSCINIASIDSKDETGHLSCRGMKVVVHSRGRR